MADDTLRRRELLATLAGLLYVASGCGGGESRPAPAPPRSPRGFVRVARLDELDFEGWKRAFAFPDLDRWVYLRLERRDAPAPADVVALSERCTHLGCPVRWVRAAERFICPCHGAVFDQDGEPLGGPASMPLIRLETRISNGEVYAAPWGRVPGRRGVTSA